VPDIRLTAVAALATASAFAIPSLAAPDTADAFSLGERTLVQGMSGKDVRRMQKLLRRTGAPVTVDSAFGPATASVLQSFERAAGLTADARLTPAEARTLRSRAAAAVEARRAAPTEATVPAVPTPGTGSRQTEEPDDSPFVGGATPDDPIGVAGAKAILNADGTATAPAGAPQVVKDIIAAGNEIHDKPYRYGGGHGQWKDSGYDCSGSVSYALHGGGLLDSSMPSGSFTGWGEAGKGDWVTIYANGGHMYMVVAGLRFDTSGASPSRWQEDMRSSSGFTIRHPKGL
jgi:peptidoglycan hydrolase-like protein with peptidoglycan-binding domain